MVIKQNVVVWLLSKMWLYGYEAWKMDQQMGEGGGGDNNAYSGKYYYGTIYTVNIDK